MGCRRCGKKLKTLQKNLEEAKGKPINLSSPTIVGFGKRGIEKRRNGKKNYLDDFLYGIQKRHVPPEAIK